MHRLVAPLRIMLALAGLLAVAGAIAFVANAALSRAGEPEPASHVATAPPAETGVIGSPGPSREPAGKGSAERAERRAARRDRAAERIDWRRSSAIGRPDSGRLVRGVELPAEGRTYFTWDPIRKRQPNRDWRRYGTHVLVRHVVRIAREFARDHPGAPRIGIGDLSRPHGGDFGPQWGGIGHASHQNGLDVDVYYPLRSGRERAPLRVSEVDMRLAQDLVDRFVAAGAEKVFVGPSTPLSGPPDVVQKLVHHDNHLHARFR